MAASLGQLQGRAEALERRLDRTETAVIRIEAAINQLMVTISASAGRGQIGAWVADGTRMLVASILAVLLGAWLSAKGHIPR